MKVKSIFQSKYQQNFGSVTLMGEKYGEASLAKVEKALSPTLVKPTVIKTIERVARNGGSYSPEGFFRSPITDSIDISVVDLDKLMITNNSSTNSLKFLFNILEPLDNKLDDKLNKAIHFVITGK